MVAIDTFSCLSINLKILGFCRLFLCVTSENPACVATPLKKDSFYQFFAPETGRSAPAISGKNRSNRLIGIT